MQLLKVTFGGTLYQG
ncbi:MAG: hypothetical protein HFE84_02890 [Lachnospiraceae bacterium]|nr:hypothetical protein [Lachnospiraceae bacterium]